MTNNRSIVVTPHEIIVTADADARWCFRSSLCLVDGISPAQREKDAVMCSSYLRKDTQPRVASESYVRVSSTSVLKEPTAKRVIFV